MNNLHGYDEFKDKRVNKLNEDVESIIEEVEEVEEEEEETVNEEVTKVEEEKLIEGAQLYDTTWKVRTRVEVPVTLINGFKKKVQSETGEDLMKKWSEQELAEEITTYVITSFMNIENLPVSLVSGSAAQPQAQLTQEMPVQTQVQPGEEGVQQVEVQIESPQGQIQPQSQEIAQTIPQVEGGI